MLARRFTIVCLLITLFGMLFSTLVAQTSRKAYSWEIGTVVSCTVENGPVCARQAGRKADLSHEETSRRSKQ